MLQCLLKAPYLLPEKLDDIIAGMLLERKKCISVADSTHTKQLRQLQSVITIVADVFASMPNGNHQLQSYPSKKAAIQTAIELTDTMLQIREFL